MATLITGSSDDKSNIDVEKGTNYHDKNFETNVDVGEGQLHRGCVSTLYQSLIQDNATDCCHSHVRLKSRHSKL